MQAAAAGQAPGLQLKELAGYVGLIMAASAVIMLLIRSGLRKPPQLATTEEVMAQGKEASVASAALKAEMTAMHREMAEKMARLEESLGRYAESCAGKAEVEAVRADQTRMGTKMASIEAFHLSMHDKLGSAMNRATRAMRDAKAAREEAAAGAAEMRDELREMRDKLEVNSVTLGRIEERLDQALKQAHNHQPRS
jgi:hypothetical protein